MEKIRSRRKFLSAVSPRVSVKDLALLKAGRAAMGTRFEVIIPRHLRFHMEAVHEALNEVRRLEGLMTVFNSESRTSEVNRLAATIPVTCEPELIEVLELSLRVWKETDGAFDVTADALWKMWGFFKREGRIPSEQEVKAALKHVGSQYLEVDSTKRTVVFLRDSLSLNFGGIGKGFALDKAAQILQNAGLAEALLHGGHSSIYAFGDPAGSRRGWKVTVRYPLQPDVDLAAVWIDSMGMATSGVMERHFVSDGKRFGHVLDPRNGHPVEHHISATALAPSGAAADALSTAFFVMSLDEIKAFCQEHPEVGAVIVPKEREDHPRVCCFGIASSCVDPFI